MILNSQKGFSLPELLIGLAITGGVVLGGAYLVKNLESNKSKTALSSDLHRIHKIIQDRMLTEEGCNAIKGKSVGSEIDVPKDFKSGTLVNNIKVESIKFASFAKSQDNAGIGTFTVKLRTGTDQAPKFDNRNIVMSLNLKSNGSIEDCKLNFSDAYVAMVDKLCRKTWGTLTDSLGMTCEQAIALVERNILEQLCKDVYGAGSPEYSGGACDLRKIHKGKMCGDRSGIQSFDAAGVYNCGPTVNVDA